MTLWDRATGRALYSLEGVGGGDRPRTPLMIIWAHYPGSDPGRGLGLGTLLP